MSDTGMSWLLHTALGGGSLLLLVWLGMKWVSGPARRQRLAEWSVIAGLVLAGLSLAPAWLLVPLPRPSTPSPISDPPPAPPTEAAEVPNSPPMTAPGFVVLFPPEIPVIPLPPDEPAPSRELGQVEEKDSAAVPEVPPAALGSQDRIVLLALGAYASGAAVVLGRWLLGHFALWRLLRGAGAAPEPAAQLFRDMGGSRVRARLLVSPRVRVPFSCGVLRPTVVLPAALAGEDALPALRWVFAHELNHLERRDARAGLVFGLGQAVYFYLPWFWWLRRQARLCQEYLADAAAARAGQPVAYAQFLVRWTEAPPVGSFGVSGPCSDLFRRIAMLLHNPTPLESRCPRRWSVLAAAGLLTLAVAVAGLGLGVHAAPVPAPRDENKKEEPKKEEPKKVEPKKEEPKKEEPKKEEPERDAPFNPYAQTIEEMLKRLPERMNPEQVKQIRKQIEQHRKEMEKHFQGFAGQAFGGPGLGAMADFMTPRGQAQQSRLGARVARPSATLVEQLDLPRDQGVVLEEVVASSPAEKAGLKSHDILLELNGKPVPSKTEDLAKLVADIKANTPVDAVVLRKGKRETVKGLSLPEPKAAPDFAPFPGGVGGGVNPFGPGLPPGGVVLPNVGGGIGFPGAAGNGVMTTTFRSNDRFTTRHQEGSLVITVTGKVADGKSTVREIRVQDGRETHAYESVDKVPEEYRDKVKNLVETTEKGNVRIEIKSP